ncbi:hypothetical protein CJ030_MR2G011752 [Morella rubra]|uniref:Uncharacterized protein n=1 Tax=Morella rubra TaxID=262757 RepID=A0A6A1WGC7_9ROSI|nr:hypothetical protein CJ030_MR2G011752 [Morella rubra]
MEVLSETGSEPSSLPVLTHSLKKFQSNQPVDPNCVGKLKCNTGYGCSFGKFWQMLSLCGVNWPTLWAATLDLSFYVPFVRQRWKRLRICFWSVILVDMCGGVGLGLFGWNCLLEGLLVIGSVLC